MEASMEIYGSFHGRWNWKLPLLTSIVASMNLFRGSCHELPCTPTYLHLLPRVEQTSSWFHKTSIRIHRLAFDLLPLKFPRTSMDFMEVELPPWKIPWKFMEVDLLPWKWAETSMKVHGRSHRRWKWKLPLFPLIAASANEFRGSFHKLSDIHASIYFHEYHKRPSTCTRLPQGSTEFLSICFHWSVHQLSRKLPWKSIYFHESFHGIPWKLPWKYMEVDGKIFTSMEISMEVGGSRFTSMEVSGNFHGDIWKFPLSVEMEASIASINCSFHRHILWKLPWVSVYPYMHQPKSTSTSIASFQLLPPDKPQP